ncbi:cilium assembly protein DZIP1L isoform X2 [Engraulis encrasicolus]|uniref:cilium assembly protein DZIP1L isoform X2 n=1 Tax=Engraulis encrasicolus TaxID=184585 RepID=UPI002FD40A0F
MTVNTGAMCFVATMHSCKASSSVYTRSKGDSLLSPRGQQLGHISLGRMNHYQYLYGGRRYSASPFPPQRHISSMPGQFSTSDAPLSGLLMPPSTPTWGPASGPAPAPAPGLLVHPFHFRARTEPVDWRRIGALDVDRVAREMDIGLLQEYITAVTFCDVSAERCPHCRNGVDPALVKVLRMSQLSTEYLLHCQDYLSAQLCGAEERLQGTLSAVEREAEEKAKMEAELQAARLEVKRRKKMMATQQLILHATANHYHKCQHCEKSFVNYSYLQAHQQRRHPEATEAEVQKRRQLEQVEGGIEELRERLRISQAALDAEREADTLRRNQEVEEQRRREAQERAELERWKDEERRKVYVEMADLKQLFLQELRDVASKNSNIEAKLDALHRREVPVAAAASVPEVVWSMDVEELQRQRSQRENEMMDRLARQKSEYKQRVKDLQSKYELEKAGLRRENDKLHRAASEGQSSGMQRLQQQLNSLSSQLHSKDKLIRSQEDKIKKLSLKPTTAPTPPVRQDALKSEEEEEEWEEEEDEEEVLRAMAKRRQSRQSLRTDPNLLRDFKPILRESLEDRLEDMGLKKGTKGISKQTLRSLSSLLERQRVQEGRKDPSLQARREQLQAEVKRRMQTARHRSQSQGQNTARATTTATQKRKTDAGGSKERHVKSKPTMVMSAPKQRKSPAQPPQPTPRAKQQQTTHTQVKKSSTPPFSSDEDEDSVGDSAYITSPTRPTAAVRLVQSGPPPVPQQNPTQGQSSAPPTDDWSDSDISEEVAGNGTRHSLTAQGSVVQTLTRSLERQLTSPMSKPPGGVRVVPPSSTPNTSHSKTVVKKLQMSDEESDMELSSIEEVSAEPLGSGLGGGGGGVGVRRSSDMGGTSGTSVWSSSTSRQGGWSTH